MYIIDDLPFKATRVWTWSWYQWDPSKLLLKQKKATKIPDRNNYYHTFWLFCPKRRNSCLAAYGWIAVISCYKNRREQYNCPTLSYSCRTNPRLFGRHRSRRPLFWTRGLNSRSRRQAAWSGEGEVTWGIGMNLNRSIWYCESFWSNNSVELFHFEEQNGTLAS